MNTWQDVFDGCPSVSGRIAHYGHSGRANEQFWRNVDLQTCMYRTIPAVVALIPVQAPKLPRCISHTQARLLQCEKVAYVCKINLAPKVKCTPGTTRA